MKRRPSDTNDFSYDSFLDVVTNLVGILILLVMFVGVRVKNAPARPPQLDPEAQAQLDVAAALEGDVLRLAGEIDEVARERDLRHEERAVLAYGVARLKHEQSTREARLTAEAQKALAARREIDAKRQQLDELEAALAGLQAAPTKTIHVENLPTPLSQTVAGREAHFQLRGGRIAPIPLEPLLNLFQDEARRQVWKLRDSPEFSSTVGPLDGFRLKYTLQRVTISANPRTGAPGGTGVRLAEWTLIPVSSRLGESIEAALAADSDFRDALADVDPRRETVTIWVYPDSFAEFRRLKRELFERGYATAGRPLPEGMPIGGSPEGSRSAAQ